MKFEIWNEIKLVFTSASSLPFSPQHPVSCPKGCMSEALLAQSALCVIIHWINNFPAKCWSFRIILCFSFLFLNLLQLWLSQQQLRMSRWEGQEVKELWLLSGSVEQGADLGISFPLSFPISAVSGAVSLACELMNTRLEPRGEKLSPCSPVPTHWDKAAALLCPLRNSGSFKNAGEWPS